MKKLIAILVVFGMLTTAVFAQADFSAGGATKATLLQGNTLSDDDPNTDFESWFWMSAGKTNDENTMRAKGSISFSTGDDDGSSLNVSGDDTWFYAWWQPIEQVFIKMGKIGEDSRYWAGGGIMAWDFQSNDMLVSYDFNYYNGFAGHLLGDGHGFMDNKLSNYTGLQVSIIPIEGLAINLGWNITGGSLEDVYLNTLAAQVVYDIPNIGQAAVGFVNGGEDEYKSIYAQYKMPISNMKFEVGFQYQIKENSDMADAPINLGLGFGYGSPWGDTFWLNARVGVSIAMEKTDLTKIGFGVIPSYDLGIFRIFVPIDIAIGLPDDGDAIFAWGVNPYIRKQMGGLEFWAGAYFANGPRWPWMGDIGGVAPGWAAGVPADKEWKDNVFWGIPIGFQWAW